MNADDKSQLAAAKKAHYSSGKIRTALKHFLFGRAASAVVSLVTLLLLLRVLEVEEYGLYVTLIALQGIIILLSGLGLDATIDRFMPELRLTYNPASLHKAVLAALSLRLLVLLVVLAVLGGIADWLVTVFGNAGWRELVPWLLAMILANGLFNLAGNILDTLLLQKWSQISGFAHVFFRLALLLGAFFFSTLTVKLVLAAEIVSTLLALGLGLYALARYFPGSLSEMRAATLFDRSLNRRILRFASLNFGARVLNQTQGPHGLRLAASHFHGIGAAASFGFVMSLADLLERYLPTTLLTRLIRPVFVSRYTAHGDFSQINGFSSLLVKVNLLVVAPVVMLAALYGNYIVEWVAGDKYIGTAWLLVMALALLIPNSHKVVIALVANTLEKNAMQFTGGIFSLLGLGLGIVLGFEFGLYGILGGALVAAVAYNFYAVAYLRHSGYAYAPDMWGAFKIVLASVAGIGAASLLVLAWSDLPVVLLAMLVGLAAYWLLFRWFGVFDASDRALMAQVLPRKAHRALKLL